MSAWLRRRLVDPIVALLRQGLAPEKLALCLALGFAIGVCPLVGTSTILCTLVALALRLNLPAIQLVNYAVYPLQLALVLPFLRLGEWLFSAPRLPLSGSEILDLARRDPMLATATLGSAAWHAVVAWAALAAAGVVIAYPPLVVAMRRIAARDASRADGTP